MQCAKRCRSQPLYPAKNNYENIIIHVYFLLRYYCQAVLVTGKNIHKYRQVDNKQVKKKKEEKKPGENGETGKN